MATEIDIRSVQITMSNGYTMTVVTTKTNVAEILLDNNIYIEEDERVNPSLESDITESQKIVITNKSEQEVQIARISESGIETSLDEIFNCDNTYGYIEPCFLDFFTWPIYSSP